MSVRDRGAHRKGTCRRKRRYPTRWAAFLAAQSATARAGHRVVPYHCQYCKGWHIGQSRAREDVRDEP